MRGGGFIFIFSRSSYRETLLVALPLHLSHIAQKQCYAFGLLFNELNFKNNCIFIW